MTDGSKINNNQTLKITIEFITSRLNSCSVNCKDFIIPSLVNSVIMKIIAAIYAEKI